MMKIDRYKQEYEKIKQKYDETLSYQVQIRKDYLNEI